MQVELGRLKFLPEDGRCTLGPTGPLVFKFALPHGFDRPSSFSQGGQMDFTGSDSSRFRIYGINTLVAKQKVVRVKLSMNDGQRWRK